MKLYIKYMVSVRCKMVVKSILEDLDMRYGAVELGCVELQEKISPEKFAQLETALSECGLELVDDNKTILVEKIKKVIIEMVNQSEEPLVTNFSFYLSQKINYNYTYMANVFSSIVGITIENYIIANKIEKVKELIMYNNLTLTEISIQLNYSSVAHLSAQFKKVTGLTPSFFKQLQQQKKLNAISKV